MLQKIKSPIVLPASHPQYMSKAAESLNEDSDGLDIVLLMDHQRPPQQQALCWEVAG